MKLHIASLTGEFDGVARTDEGMAVFVPGALPGEDVDARIIKQEKRFARAVLEKVETASALRREPFCPYYGRCGGCAAQHMEYAASLQAKKQAVEDALSRLGGLKDVKVEEVVGMAHPFACRNKTEFAVGSSGTGFIAEGSRRLVEVDDCPMQKPEANRAARALTVWKKEHPQADIRHLVTRVNRKGQTAVVLTGYGKEKWPGLLEHLRKELHGLVSIHRIRLKNRPVHALDGVCEKIWGEDFITETLLGVEYAISPLSFFQVNPDQAEKLYAIAVEMADLHEGVTCVDAYCGVGAISLQLAKTGAKVLGVEVIPDAVKNARANAKRNDMTAEFMAADAPEALIRMRKNGEKLDVLVVDPPRAGLSEAFVEAALIAEPERIVYVSCNPATLARDLKRMGDMYQVQRVKCVDMFPWAGHVETVVLLSQLRQKPDDYIEVDIDVIELEGTAEESKATYDQIKKYVFEQTGLKVSNLYIAQTKKKCGLELGENFNLPKSENAKQPQCPEDKERAIVEALKHFKMVE